MNITDKLQQIVTQYPEGVATRNEGGSLGTTWTVSKGNLEVAFTAKQVKGRWNHVATVSTIVHHSEFFTEKNTTRGGFPVGVRALEG